MEAEHVEGPLKRAQAAAGDDRAAVRLERTRDDVEIRSEFLDGCVGRRVADRLAERHHMVELARRLGEARVHAGDRSPVGLVAPGERRIGGAVGQRIELGADPDERRGQRQDAAELVQLVEIIAERPGALLPHRLVQHLGGDERIAVAVAADPRANAQERRDRPVAALVPEGIEPVLDRAIEARQLLEEGVVVIGEAVGDLVDHLQPRLAQHVGAPEDDDAAPEPLLVERQLLRIAQRPVALVEQLGDFELAGERALAADFGRVGGQHRAHQRGIEKVASRPGSTPASPMCWKAKASEPGRGAERRIACARLRRM